MTKIVRTFAGGGGRALTAFTMAEILLSLTIIGVVAAITLPSLTGNINERTWNTQRKALYARMSQALALMPSLNGYGQIVAEQKDADGNITQSAVDTAAETFVTEGLSKVLKINNICDSDHLADCGLPNKIIPFDMGTSNSGNISLASITTLLDYNPQLDTAYYSMQNTKAVAFETANGESMLVHYNPKCTSAVPKQHYKPIQPFLCVNFIYDLNGTKGPNTGGKDIGFITALYATDPSVVMAMPAGETVASIKQDGVTQLCKSRNPNLRMPNIDELAAMYFNRTLIGMSRKNTGYYWSGSSAQQDNDPQSKWLIQFDYGLVHRSVSGTSEPVRCIER